jgi:formylglycine-generating enzyme required for sulfatase activity
MNGRWSLCIPVLAAAALGQRPQFVKIPPGSFEMGCVKEDGCSEVLPRRRVEFDRPFWMAQTEVTVGQYRAFVKATGYRTDAETAGDVRTWKNPGFRVAGAQPVVYMTLNDAEAYCQWIGARVPGEAEWEYAARAGTATHHYWGEEIDGRFLWYRENSGGHPHPVGKKPPNAWGLRDVEGNVWEWVTGAGPHTSVRTAGYGSLRGGSFVTCPEPYAPINGRRQRMIGLTVPFSNTRFQQFNRSWRRDDAGFRCARPSPE